MDGKPQVDNRVDKAIGWLRNHSVPEGGVFVSSRQRVGYPEVTGYLIPSLYAWGERDLARQYVRWLVGTQKADGSFPAPGGDASFAFDTGQAVRGLVAALPEFPELEGNLRRACDWLVGNSSPEGRLPLPPSIDDWSMGARGHISEAVHLYILPGLKAAGEALGEPGYTRFVEKSLDYHVRNFDLSDFNRRNMLTHLFVYIQEALIDLGAQDLARRGLDRLAARMGSNGAIPAYFDIDWVCTPGQIQAAISWFKLGEYKLAERALAFIERFQNGAGGFRGSYGSGADYFADEEPSWAVKFFLDASALRIRKFFDVEHAIFPSDISPDDGRVRAVFELAGELSGKRILDVGCGKGRFASLIRRACPSAEVTGLDVSEELLRSVPAGIATRQGSMLHLPFPDESFDVVYCVEALEHAVRIDRAVAEMCRVLRPGGTLVVIDKNAEKWGAFSTPSWEKWFTPSGLTGLIGEYLAGAGWKFIGYDRSPVPDGLFVAWHGSKPGPAVSAVPATTGGAQGLAATSTAPTREVADPGEVPLEAPEWFKAITGGATPAQVAAAVREGRSPEWLEPALENSAPGQVVVELGSGTGQLSAALAARGRKVVLVDYSAECLAFSRAVFESLGLSAEFVQADVTRGIPLTSESADLVWSCGLLEHFKEEEIVSILRESARISRGRVLSLVPNARSLPYRLGKHVQEESGSWRWGREEPRTSMAAPFEAAGLGDIREGDVAPRHALRFLSDVPGLEGLADFIGGFYDRAGEAQLRSLGQGYLLSTTGAPRKLRRLAVVPSDPLEAYEKAGYGGWLKDYYNPEGYFDEVWCLSPVETVPREAHGMRVVPTSAAQLPERLRELKIDVVRAYGGFWPADFAVGGRVPGIPVVVSIHDTDPSLVHDSVAQADHVLSISCAVRETLISRGVPAGKIVDFRNRVDLSVFARVDDPAAREAFRRRFPGRYLALHVGRKTPQKNLETLIRAIETLGPDYAAIFIGRGDVAPYRELARGCGVLDRCHFVESVESTELSKYYSFTDVMCTPSLWEGFGIVFIEALACGSVVITSDIGPMNEYIVDGVSGILVRDYLDPKAIASAIARGCTDPALRATLSANARDAARPFGKERVDREEVSIYRRVMGSPAGA